MLPTQVEVRLMLLLVKNGLLRHTQELLKKNLIKIVLFIGLGIELADGTLVL
jgi:hypothetical protein